ncbi:hypothetical protein [Enterococcus faecalis]|uniref:hypothetical protein n=4 Tax=Enterococcus faecalis TaxID=1351 RepID=UPI001F4954B8|nr:hypothetical protein [Enterococcus faecalis]
MSGHKTIERTHVRKSMSQRGEILMHLKELDAKRLVLSFVLPCFSKAFLSSGGGGWSEIEINTNKIKKSIKIGRRFFNETTETKTSETFDTVPDSISVVKFRHRK